MLKPLLPRQQKLHRHHGLQDLQANPERANRPSIQSRFNQVKDFFNSLKSIPPYLRKITKMVNNSNDQQRLASASIFCEDPFSSSTPYAEELEYNIDFLIEHQDIRQCHFPGDQNRAEDRYEEEAYNPNEEGQHVFQSLSPD